MAQNRVFIVFLNLVLALFLLKYLLQLVDIRNDLRVLPLFLSQKIGQLKQLRFQRSDVLLFVPEVVLEAHVVRFHLVEHQLQLCERL